MPNILLTRIDNRLIHGQVGMTWTNWLGANLVLVADDLLAADETQQSLMDMAISGSAESRYFTLQKTIDVIHKAADRQKIFMVVRTPQAALQLVEGGVPIPAINVGNLHYAEGKKQVTKVISVSEDDIRCFRALEEKGVHCTAQGTPDDKKTPILSLINQE
ncbi:PTS N-acetylgalactosamine transporter subunit IIB [Suttonella sp. R2A3]|uniref:PTS N-acetylgalactosamine transporter subunit IIB n=1 Tax=Suttonella sp. R2A3 TaxID=2908648 RepID=UPI001F2DA496|nr:PTS N-acetylgalactosamine transporter subunit IIB [Suttonella sp. R2A3]UJF24058.1 PTS N-acetylgalactosamine transporter subunit IIB [Suttonella sp. R2A3]